MSKEKKIEQKICQVCGSKMQKHKCTKISPCTQLWTCTLCDSYEDIFGFHAQPTVLGCTPGFYNALREKARNPQ